MNKNINIINEYIKTMNYVRELNDIMALSAYRWIRDNIGLVNIKKYSIEGSKVNIGKAYCQFKLDDTHTGFDWKFDNYKNPKFIIITYSIIKNEYGDIEDKEIYLSFEEFAKYIY